MNIEPGILNVELRGSVREAPALLFLPALLATGSGSLRSPLARLRQRRGSLPPLPPETGRIGGARQPNSLVGREKRAFWPACFTTWPRAVVKAERDRKSLGQHEISTRRAIRGGRTKGTVVNLELRIWKSSLLPHPSPFCNRRAAKVADFCSAPGSPCRGPICCKSRRLSRPGCCKSRRPQQRRLSAHGHPVRNPEVIFRPPPKRTTTQQSARLRSVPMGRGSSRTMDKIDQNERGARSNEEAPMAGGAVGEKIAQDGAQPALRHNQRGQPAFLFSAVMS